MPTVVSPRVNDRLLAGGRTPGERRFWGHFGLQETGQTLIRESGVWSAVSYPTQARCEAADTIVDPSGYTVPGVLMGGHIHPVTQTVANEIAAANLGAVIT